MGSQQRSRHVLLDGWGSEEEVGPFPVSRQSVAGSKPLHSQYASVDQFSLAELSPIPHFFVVMQLSLESPEPVDKKHN